MKKLRLAVFVFTTIGIVAAGGFTLYKNQSAQPQKSTTTAAANSSGGERAPDPTTHDTFDIEFSKKLLLYHQLAAQLDNYAKDNATTTTLRAYAAQKSEYNAAQAGAYATLLDAWGEKYTNLEDFPKVAGGGCSGYPVFPGMLPHTDVSAYLQSAAQEVDERYLALMIKHHEGISSLVKAEGHFINYGELIALRDAFYAEQDMDMERLKSLRENLGFSES